MGSGLFGIALSGLNAAQAGLTTTGHNIANAGTPGFHRQEIVQSNAVPQFTGAGFLGRGVDVDTVRRVYSDFLDNQAARAQAQASYYAAYSTQVGQIDNLLSDSSAGLAPALQGFFDGVHEVASHPESVPSRQAMLSAGSSLVARFQALDHRLTEFNTGINAQIGSTVTSVNAYAREIASMNAQIRNSPTGVRQSPNDLLDHRDQLISELNALVGTSVLVQSDGTVNVSIGSGQSLVVGTQAFQLAAIASAETPEETDVAYLAGGATILMSSTTLSEGTLGALLAFRSSALTDTRNELGRIATGLVQTFNAQHRLGQDLTGALGGNFFSLSQPGVAAGSGNTGTAAIAASIASASSLQASDYSLRFTGGVYQLTRLRDGTTSSYATLPQTVDGVTIQLTGGAPANGDTFLIEPTRYAARNLGLAINATALIAAAAPIRTGTATANIGTATISAGVANAPLSSNVQQPVSIVFTSATTFNVTGTGTGNPTGVAYTTGGAITYNGWTVRISGAPSAGDQFTISPNTNGVADNRNAALLADLQVANTLIGGTTSYHGAYGQLTSAIGNATRETQIASAAQEAIALRTREAQQSVSGVNLDEEAANLLRYQQAYQASAKVMEVASSLFDTILRIGG